MILAYCLFVGLFVTVFGIAVLTRLAGRLGAVDLPGPRKVHSAPIPRVGGIAIAFSAYVAIVIWLPLNERLAGFLIGSAIIVATGINDDIRSLHYRWKLLGQTLGITALLLSGVRFEQLPFFPLGSVPDAVSYVVTFVFLLGVTNAFNLIDGLDGLAAGCIVLSIATISLLAILVGDASMSLIGFVIIGGLLGFLRYNTFPASVFMGDAGSQFLGFSAGFLSIALVTDVNPALNPGLAFLILGLPLLDTFSVAIRRLLQRRSPFVGDKQHLHHRLLAIGLSHVQTVSALYFIQAAMVATAFLVRYESDALVLAAFAFFGTAIFSPLYLIERVKNGPTSSPQNGKYAPSLLSRRFEPIAKRGHSAVGILFCVLAVAGAISAKAPSRDVAILCIAMAATAVCGLTLFRWWRPLLVRLSLYVVSLVICFLLTTGSARASVWENWVVNGCLAVLGGLVILSTIWSKGGLFKFTPQDLLMTVIVVTVPNLNLESYFQFPIGILILQVSVLFYSIEFVLSKPGTAADAVLAAGILALLAVAAKAYI